MNSSVPPVSAAVAIRSLSYLISRIWGPLAGCALLVAIVGDQGQVAAASTIAALGGILLLYRACRHGVRFDDRGITVRNFYRTYKLGWHEVSRFTDGWVGVSQEGGRWAFPWALRIELNDGRSVTAEGTMLWYWSEEPNESRRLATLEQVATRWQIPAQLTGKVQSSL